VAIEVVDVEVELGVLQPAAAMTAAAMAE